MKTIPLLLLLLLILILATEAHPSGQPPDQSKEKKMEHKNKYTNHLINESSPYLLLHAHNPVDWYPWGQEALKKAKKENKLLIISIGYAACHWCHVMEEESFSNEGVAEVMNKYFVSIKVDREERPDIDQVYMDAAQMLTGQGGWPLNAIALPDGRPIFAGTYYPKQQWVRILKKVHELYKAKPQQVEQQAENLTKGIRTANAVNFNPEKPEFDPKTPDQIVDNWKKVIDFEWGGERRAPKFPLPIGYRYLLAYHYLTQNSGGDSTLSKKALEAVKVTLDRMAMGGIYDQVGGGFARYSTDEYWKVPHFEKMLYDNGQLVSLYSYAYQLTKNPMYKTIVYETLEFVARELTSPQVPNGGRGFYSSLDADSEGEEGKFYIWPKTEIQNLLGKNAPLIIDYYNVTDNGNWEKGHNILFRTKADEIFAADKKIDVQQLRERLAKAKKQLLAARCQRVRPPLDDKILTAWNALMLNGYVDAYRVFNDKKFLKRALENAGFIVNHMLSDNGRLNRNYKDGKSSINAFLDDYAFTIQAFISLYQATFDEKWLFTAEKLLKYTLDHFYDKKSRMFYYTSDQDPELIARKIEIPDNVIPSSNSQMAVNLYLLGEYFYNEDYIRKSKQMLNNVKSDLVRNGPYYANWALLLTYFIHPIAEVAIVGDEWEARRKELDRYYLPHMILMGGKTEGKLPLLEGKLIKGQTTIFVCKNKACRLPVTDIKQALLQL
ncbi:MAG: thioredoxin domain-containing protein, partial [Candidatus Aminicenantes bacterium]